MSNSLPARRVFYMVISEFQNIIYKHVSKYYVEIAEGSPEPPPLLLLLVFTFVPDLNTQRAPSFSDSKSRPIL